MVHKIYSWLVQLSSTSTSNQYAFPTATTRRGHYHLQWWPVGETLVSQSWLVSLCFSYVNGEVCGIGWLGEQSARLKQARIKIKPMKDCYYAYKALDESQSINQTDFQHYAETAICASGRRTDSCQVLRSSFYNLATFLCQYFSFKGDSGGPMSVRHEDGK